MCIRDSSGTAQPSSIDPQALFGRLPDNRGVEAIATTSAGTFLCAERQATSKRPNCALVTPHAVRYMSVVPPEPILDLGGVPTDADADSAGNIYVLFRSYSPGDGSGAAVVSVAKDGARTPLATLRPPLTLDNMEGLAVREEGGHVMVYLVSDNNGSVDQRALLMKFAVIH